MLNKQALHILMMTTLYWRMNLSERLLAVKHLAAVLEKF